MATLPELAFAFARFVAREYRPAHRTFGPVAARRRWNSGRRHQRRPDRHGGFRHRRAPYCVHRRHRRGNHWTQRRVQTPVAAAEPAVVAVPEVAAEEAVGALNEDEASASNAFVDADELLKVSNPSGSSTTQSTTSATIPRRSSPRRPTRSSQGQRCRRSGSRLPRRPPRYSAPRQRRTRTPR